MKKLFEKIESGTTKYILCGFGLFVLTIFMLLYLGNSGFVHMDFEVLSLIPIDGPFFRLFIISIVPFTVSLALFMTGLELAYFEMSIKDSQNEDAED